MPTFTDPYGVVISYDEYPRDAPKAIIQIAHGIGEHAGRYKALAKALNTAGFGVYVADMRGHGRTGMQQFDNDTTQLGHLGAGGLRAAIGNIKQLIGRAHV